MITIVGNTYPHREFLKSIRARWDGHTRRWTVAGLSSAQRAELLALPGIAVTGIPIPPPPGTPAPEPEPVPDWLAEAIAAVEDITKPGRYVIGVDLAEPIVRTNPAAIVHGDTTYQHHFARQDAGVHFGFDSLADQLAFVRAIPQRVQEDGTNGRNFAWRESPKGTEFTGTGSMTEALEMAEQGTWSEGIELAQSIVEYFSTQHAQRKRRRNAVVGGRVNVGRLLAGNPKHMIARPKQDGSKFITIFVDVIMDRTIEAENAIIRAAVVAAIVDMLENNGYRCEIIAGALSTWMLRTRYTVTTRLKSAGDRLNLSDIIFALGHPSYLRRIIFAMLASEESLRDIWKSMGGPDELFTARHQPGKNEIYIDKIHDNVHGDTIEKALQIFKLIVPADFPITLMEQ